MLVTYTKEQIQEIRKCQELTYELLDYARTKIEWILDLDRKYHILDPEDVERAGRLVFTAGKSLDRYYSPSDESLQGRKPDGDLTEPDDDTLIYLAAPDHSNV